MHKRIIAVTVVLALAAVLLGLSVGGAQAQGTPVAPTAAATSVPPGDGQPSAAGPIVGAATPTGPIERKDTLVLDTEGGKVVDALNFNPYAQGRGGSNGIVNALIEPMFTTNLATGQFEPWLAESITPNADFTKWTLKLREGVAWSDGQPMTADDVIFTIEMIQKFPDLATPHKFTGVTVAKVDEQTVELTLPEADPRYQLTVWAGNLQSQEVRIVPKHIWEGVADPVTFTNYDPAKGWPVFSGAWILDKVVSDTEFQYKRNDNWWGAKSGWRPLPAVKQIVWTLYGDENTRAAAIQKNDLDSLAIASPPTFLTLQAQNPKIIAWSAEPPYGNADVCDRHLEFNLNIEPWNDPDMRWAVAQTLDREKIIDIAFAGFSKAAYTFLPDFRGLDAYREALDESGLFDKYPIQKLDPAAAKAAFEAKGYKLNAQGVYEKDGKPLKVVVTTFEDVIIQALTGVIIENLRAVGIDATQDPQPIPTFVDNLLNNKFEMMIFFGACGSTVDPWRSMDSYSVRHIPEAGKPIDSFYSNMWHWNTEAAKQYSALVVEIGKLQPGDPKINDLFLQAMDLWYKELPTVPLVHNYLIWPNNTTYWTGWPTDKEPYMQPDMAGTNTLWILHNLKPAQ